MKFVLRKKISILVAAILLAITSPVTAPFDHVVAAPAPNPSPVFRFYNYHDGSHFFTNSESEKATVETRPDIYHYEGVAFYSYPTQVNGASPVYRFYNFKNGVHFYTINQSEYQNVLTNEASTYRYEGISYYALPSQMANSVPVHRFYNFRQGVHFYTVNQAEATNLNNTAYNTYHYEGIAYYLPSQLTFSGTGNQVTESFILPTSLSVFSSNYTGPSNFIVTLKESNTGNDAALLANEIGNSNISVPYGVGENRYVMQVQSYGNWSITIEQPSVSAGVLTSFSDRGTKATQLFTIPAGGRTLSYSHDGSSNFIVNLWDSEGNYVDLPVNEIGAVSGGAYISSNGGNYMLGVQADGNWAISIH